MTRYSVDLSGGITESFFTDLENVAGSTVQLRKRLTGITIELFQNIIKHAIDITESRLIIQKEGSTYSVLAINTITASDVTFLQDKINYINKLDHTRLKEQHTKILAKTTLSKKSGAGLGFYRMALRSASTLVPAFKQLDQNHFTFSLHVILTA